MKFKDSNAILFQEINLSYFSFKYNYIIKNIDRSYKNKC